MLLLFGYALTLDVDRIPTLVYDSDRSPAEPRADRALRRLALLPDPRRTPDSYATIEQEIDREQLPAGRGHPARLRRATWPAGRRRRRCSCSSTAATRTPPPSRSAMPTRCSRPTRSSCAAKALNAQGRRRASTPPVDARLRVWYNSELKSKNYIVPGLIAVILMIIARAAHVADHRARVGDGHHGAAALDARCARPRSCSARCRPTSSLGHRRHGRDHRGRASACSRCPCAAASSCWPLTGCALPDRRAVLGHLPLRRSRARSAGLPAGHADLVPAGLPALGLRLLHREHAAADPGRHLHVSRRATSSRF